jgi:hypothetical protein
LPWRPQGVADLLGGGLVDEELARVLVAVASQVRTLTPRSRAAFMAGASTLGSLGDTQITSAFFKRPLLHERGGLLRRPVGRAVVDEFDVAQIVGGLLRALGTEVK